MSRKLLKDRNLKITKSRLAILDLLKEKSPLTAEEINDLLKDERSNLSSIYRNLSVFVENHLLIKTVGHNNIAYYQLNNDHHKHQLICKNCNKSISIEFCPTHQFEEQIEKETGYEIMSHNFEFIGLCPNCKNKK